MDLTSGAARLIFLLSLSIPMIGMRERQPEIGRDSQVKFKDLQVELDRANSAFLAGQHESAAD